MRILILFLPDDSESVREIKTCLDKFHVKTDIHECGKGTLQTVNSAIYEATHILTIFRPQCMDLNDFSYCMGYGRGKELPVFIFFPQEASIPEKILKNILLRFGNRYTADSYEELEIHFIREMNIWNGEMKKKSAREALTRLGIPMTEEAMAECVSDGASFGVENFLTAGFSPDTRNKKGVPLLCLAVRNHHRGVVQLLLNNKADVNTVSGDRGNTPVMDAAADGNMDLLPFIIKAGADLNVRSKNGQTSLILAVGQGAMEAAEALIKGGADPFIKDNLGMSAKKYAELFRQERILKLIGAMESAGEEKGE